jgi:hypothetical protein
MIIATDSFIVLLVNWYNVLFYIYIYIYILSISSFGRTCFLQNLRILNYVGLGIYYLTSCHIVTINCRKIRKYEVQMASNNNDHTKIHENQSVSPS